MAVIGKTESEKNQVQVTDIGSGFDGPVAQDQFVATLDHANRSRTKSINWPALQPSR